jgi:cytochrome c peroxidase
MRLTSRSFYVVLASWIALASCADVASPVEGTPYAFNLAPHMPLPVVPADNPVTVEKVALGRRLFYDRILSADGSMACASCHDQAHGFATGDRVNRGVHGDTLSRNSMSLAGVAYFPTLTWFNPTQDTLERQALVPMFGERPPELGLTGHEARVLQHFRSNVRYRALFSAAFPSASDPYTIGNTVKAIASFERTLISGDSPYDRYILGRTDAMNASAIRGEALFFSERTECYHCHVGPMLTTAFRSASTQTAPRGFENNGLYNLDATGRYPEDSPGLSEFTRDPRDHGRMRVPSLRNVAVTGPYMHDGSLATLDDVITHYASGGSNHLDGPNRGDGRANPNKSSLLRGFELTPDERTDLRSFLEAMTDETFLRDPRHAAPTD